MSWKDTVDKYLPEATGGDSVMDPSMLVDEDEDDEDYVPESLRGMFKDADDFMSEQIREVLEIGTEDSSQRQLDDDFLEGARTRNFETEMSFGSPSLTFDTPNNPAADLTASQAKSLAMEGVTPRGAGVVASGLGGRSAQVNLQSVMDQEHEVVIEEDRQKQPQPVKAQDQVVEKKTTPQKQQPKQPTPKEPAASSPSRKVGALFGLGKSVKVAPTPPPPPTSSSSPDSKKALSPAASSSPSSGFNRLFKPTSSSQARAQPDLPLPPRPSSSPEKSNTSLESSNMPIATSINPTATSLPTPQPSSRLLHGTSASSGKLGKDEKPKQHEPLAPDPSLREAVNLWGKAENETPAPTLTAAMNISNPATKDAEASPKKGRPPPPPAPPQQQSKQNPPRPPPPPQEQHQPLEAKQNLPAYMLPTAAVFNKSSLSRKMDQRRPERIDIPNQTKSGQGQATKTKMPKGNPAVIKSVVPSKHVGRGTQATSDSRRGPGSTTSSELERRGNNPSGLVTGTTTGAAADFRVMRGTTWSTAKRDMHPRVNHHSPPPLAVATPPPSTINRRLFLGTASKNSRSSKASSSTSVSQVIPSQMPSRLLQRTEASLMKVASSPTNGVQTMEASKELERRRAEEAKRKNEVQRRFRLRSEEIKRKQLEIAEKTKESLERAKARKERADAIEQDRLEKLKEKIAEKENRSIQNDLKQLHKLDLRPAVPPKKRSMPTIPVGPKFATDSRVGGTRVSSATTATDTPYLEQSDDVLRKSLRTDSFDAPSRLNAGPVTLTIPQGPNLSTSKRHLEKTSIPHADVVDTTAQIWETGLRSFDALQEPDNGPLKLTVPVTPKFSKMRQREPPQSTAEKEKETMEFYMTHPFKARPVRMHDVSPAPRPPKSERRLATPQPFYLRTAHLTHNYVGKEVRPMEAHAFRARPMPDFSGIKSIPITGKTPEVSKDRLTKPQPFHFHTDERLAAHSPRRLEGPTDETEKKFKARPMPDFGRLTPVIIDRDPTRASKFRPAKAEPEVKPMAFKARPMPDFSSESPIVSPRAKNKITPRTSSATKTSPSATSSFALDEVEQATIFRARPMPKLAQPQFSVTPRNPIPIRSLQKEGPAFDVEVGSPEFKARPLPDFSKLPVPVRDRDPKKLRSPEIEKRKSSPAHVPEISRGTGYSPGIAPTATVFKAKPLPDLSKLAIPVKDRDPNKVKRAEGTAPQNDIQGSAPLPKPKQSPNVAPVPVPVRARIGKPSQSPAANGDNRETSTTSSSTLHRRLNARKANTKPAGNGLSSPPVRVALSNSKRTPPPTTPAQTTPQNSDSPFLVLSAESKMKALELKAKALGEERQRQAEAHMRLPNVEAKAPVSGKTEQEEEDLRNAMSGWGQGLTMGQQDATPTKSNHRPGGNHRQEMAKEAQRREDDTMRMANEVMKAAQDELSLRGRGDDYAEDYNPSSDDPMNNVFTFTGR